MASTCPDNSTDCLLRAILDANSTSLDSATFGFTVVFTVIAFVVSVVALFTSLIAAGPGRLKASERAIGRRQHEQRSDTRFSWQEFRFRTAVNVPVIDTRKILEHAPEVISVHGGDADDAQASMIGPRTVAGWSQLLDDLSLNDIDFSTMECLTDYLPGDIPAAPAWAKFESILFLVIMKGCSRLNEEDGYINATGIAAQLTWNMHPNLGPVAIYRAWNVKETSKHQLEDVQKMIPIFLGELYLAGTILLKPIHPKRDEVPIYFDFPRIGTWSTAGWRRCQHEHDYCSTRRDGYWAAYFGDKNMGTGPENRPAALASCIYADRPAKAKAFPTSMVSIHKALNSVYEEYFPWLMLVDNLDDHVLQTLAGSEFVEFGSDDAWFDIPNICNTKLTSWLIAASGQASSNSNEQSSLERPFLKPLKHHAKYHSAKSDPATDLSDNILSSRLRISRTAVRYVAAWLTDDTYFANIAVSERMGAITWLTYQLAELDYFLASAGDDALCAAGNLTMIGSRKFGVVHWTKLSRRIVMPEALDAFGIQYKTTSVSCSNEVQNTPGYLLVGRYLDREMIQRLAAYTRKYIERNRHELRTIKCDGPNGDGFYYTTTKHLPSAEFVEPSGTSNGNDQIPSPSRPKNTATIQIETVVDESGDLSGPISQSTTQGTDTAVESESESGQVETQVDNGKSEKIEKSKDEISAGDEVTVMIDERIAALEALVFFRAAVFGALLATGTDTSLILMSDKRHQLVQVQ